MVEDSLEPSVGADGPSRRQGGHRRRSATRAVGRIAAAAFAIVSALLAQPAPVGAQVVGYAGEALIATSPTTPSGDRVVDVFASADLCNQLRANTGVANLSQFIVHRLDTPKGQQVAESTPVATPTPATLQGLPLVSCVDSVAVIETDPIPLAERPTGLCGVTRYTNQRFNTAPSPVCESSTSPCLNICPSGADCRASICKTFAGDLRECRRIARPGGVIASGAALVNASCEAPTPASPSVQDQILTLLHTAGFTNPRVDYLTVFDAFSVTTPGDAGLCVFSEASIENVTPPATTSAVEILDIVNIVFVETAPSLAGEPQACLE